MKIVKQKNDITDAIKISTLHKKYKAIQKGDNGVCAASNKAYQENHAKIVTARKE